MNELREEVREFTRTKAFQEILDISRRLTFDTKDEDRLLQAFAQLTINVTNAIENESITFNSEDAKEDLHGLLAILLKRVSPDQETVH